MTMDARLSSNRLRISRIRAEALRFACCALSFHRFVELGRTRAVCPAMSRDGRAIVFASREDLVGRNADRNSEIFLFDGVKLNQLTETFSAGNFQPSITNDGRTVAFSSNGEIFVYDTIDQKFTQLTSDGPERSAVSPKISGDGAWVYYKRNLTADNADLVRIDTEMLTSRVLASGCGWNCRWLKGGRLVMMGCAWFIRHRLG